MRALFIILLGLVLGIVVAQVALEDPGYVLITLKPWSVELSLVTFLALLAVTLLILYTVVRTLVRLGQAPQAMRTWRQRQLQSKARRSHDLGLLHLSNGEWAKAEKRLISYLDQTEAPTLYRLAAARAADGRGDTNRRDSYLAEIQPRDQIETLALILTRAELQAGSGELEPALASLRSLRHQAPKNTKVLALLARVQDQLGEWRGVLDTIKEARRLKALPPAECDALEAKAASELLRVLPVQDLSGFWHSLRRDLRDNEMVIDAYAQRLLASGAHDEAEELLRKAIDRQWRPGLTRRYGQVRGKDLVKQLKAAEQWAVTHDDDPDMMLALAHLSLANQLWGKARAALEACIANGGSVEAYRELGHLLEKLDDTDSALNAYRDGLEHAGTGTGDERPPPRLKSV